jgi:CDP-diacylglycerol---serine O-phosphatidyltransferase
MNLRALLPSAFTVGNIVCGLMAITMALNGRLVESAWLILLGSVLDGLDGTVARAVGAHTHFGREFDSFADFVTFGVAPVVMLFGSLAEAFDFWAWLIGGVYLVAGAFRLTRHNLMFDPVRISRYTGLPITSAGMTLAAYMLFCGRFNSGLPLAWPALTVFVALSILMVSSLEYERFPLIGRIRPRALKFLLFILLSIPIIIYPSVAILALMGAYIIYGLGVNLVGRTERGKAPLE